MGILVIINQCPKNSFFEYIGFSKMYYRIPYFYVFHLFLAQIVSLYPD